MSGGGTKLCSSVGRFHLNLMMALFGQQFESECVCYPGFTLGLSFWSCTSKAYSMRNYNLRDSCLDDEDAQYICVCG